MIQIPNLWNTYDRYNIIQKTLDLIVWVSHDFKIKDKFLFVWACDISYPLLYERIILVWKEQKKDL